MDWELPGTNLKIRREDAGGVEALFSSMFLAGGMVLSQVASLTGLEAYTVQNWVKRGFLPPPGRKRYSMNQLCRIIIINMLKGALPMEQICGLLGYVNSRLDDEGDDIIDDSTLYFLFVHMAAHIRQLGEPQALSQALEQGLADYREPAPGAKIRVEKALRIMLTAWVSVRMRQQAEQMLRSLEEQ